MRDDKMSMKRVVVPVLAMAAVLLAFGVWADNYDDTINLFQHAGESAAFFNNSYGYAVFPTIGKGGLFIGGAHGNGRVYRHGQHVGDASMTQVSIGFQAGGEAYSQIIFFRDKDAFDQFTHGDFEFSADVNAVAIKAAASASAGTQGAAAGASGSEQDARTAGTYYKGMAVFTIAKGGAMYQASVGGQKFSYKPR